MGPLPLSVTEKYVSITSFKLLKYFFCTTCMVIYVADSNHSHYSVLLASNMFSICYFQIKVIPSLLRKNLVTEVDIIIGTTHRSLHQQRHSSSSREDMSSSVYDLLRKLDPSPPTSPCDVGPTDGDENCLDMNYFA